MTLRESKTTTADPYALDEAEREWRRNRFRVLVCIDGSQESFEGLKIAAKLSKRDECDIIIFYVRLIDQGLRAGGLEVRVARENMLEWGLELPGVKDLRRALHYLIEQRGSAEEWDSDYVHRDVRGDPVGDNKVVFRHESGQSVILGMKTAPDVAGGILDQYELGPYNLIILGHPSRWRGELSAFWNAGVVQKVSMLAPCSVLTAREGPEGKGHLICTDGSEHAQDAVLRDAVLAKCCNDPVSLLSVARKETEKAKAQAIVDRATALLTDSGIEVENAFVRIGEPVEQIVTVGADYSQITVSDSGKNRLRRFFAGSVAFDVMGKAEVSVLNVR